MRPPFAFCVAALALSAACSDSTTVVAVDAAPDLVADALDAPGLDIAPVDVARDAPTPDVRVGCSANADCAADPVGRVCDVASGRCVGCLATADTCPAGQYCVAGSNTCAPGCRNDDGCPASAGVDAGPGATRRCDPATHACFDCVRDEHCPSGTLCVGNVCVTGCSATRACPTGQTCCAGACVDAQTNTAHCGRCDNRCAVPSATAACLNGACSVGMCTAPNADCDGAVANGCETDTARSPAHCGACGNACPAVAHAASACTAATCGFTCDPGFADCDGDRANGCEADLNASTAHCGRCANRCGPPNAVAACAMGSCAIGACAAGFGDCDMNASNGCEVALGTSASHCGACGAACPARANAIPGCLAGGCVSACLTGFTDCDGDPANGCEVDVRTSAAHCGGCGRACSFARASSSCVMSVCALTACAEAYGNCDGDTANGCETSLATAVTHCGACGAVCPAVAGATPTCTAGRCGFACVPGRGDCDGMPSNGCETDLTANPAACGICGGVCPSGVCAGGACQAPTCSDRVRNGAESDVDCGGTCRGCELCQTCGAGTDCASTMCSSAGRCTFRAEVYIPWLDSCHGAGGPARDVVVPSVPAGTYDLTALSSAGTVWNPVSFPSTGWFWGITCSNLASTRLATPSGVLYPTPDAAFAGLMSTTDSVPFAGGELRCFFSDSACSDNQGGVRFRMERACP